MRWTQQVADVVTKTQCPLTWRTPSGFVVRMSIKEQAGRRIETQLNGRRVQLTMLHDTEKLSAKDHRQGLAPNWIHSLDAAALHITISRLLEQGVRSVLAIHDSYGTHAGHMTKMARTLRAAFVEIYSQDVIGRFVADLKRTAPSAQIPPPPAMGQLNIEDVLNSTYFFA
jgi:DNA-directed RNA polymerase